MDTFRVTEGVHGIDIGLFDDGVTAVYLFDDEEPALVDAGTAVAADDILEGIAECGVDPADLRHLVVSHVHADHSGAAADLCEAAPDAEVYIHESTADHLVDPSGLVASSRRAMGDLFEQLGAQGPVPRERVVEVGDDGLTLDLGANTLELRHHPGHSPDHLAVWNPERDLLFAAECAVMYLARAERWLPPATLPNFDADLVAEAIEELRDLDPETVVFPHFGESPLAGDELFDLAARELDRFDERIRALYDEHGDLDATKAAVAAELIDCSPPYDPAVESFYANLVTEGFLRHHGAL
ncbi:MBL fold metallo-hydrolase [Salinirubellus salinus]|jgi:glyoxylase-like metal-dependent hydrolase (beta-lactamase superfamily II)|uniref:MBL fold metallo-hydrolase n=1 Tax=Salinirubellus salinus TaxID=1364945 RepID=A0A9E7R0B0_9EURY|nr:MBL fold metallo-hydrolase [Salinirubellus salinus]UWM53277.1 MBL fold metallo-hydrolase [Salinirubellus salinus]